MAQVRYELITFVEEERKYVVYAEEGSSFEDIQTQAYDEGDYVTIWSETTDVSITSEPPEED
jgi:hypothetical protein